MKDTHRTRRTLLGSAIIAGLVLLAAAIFLLDDLFAALRGTYRVLVVLPEAPGVVLRSPVWVGGHEVGEVTSLSFRRAPEDGSTQLVLALELPNDARDQVRSDSEVRITSLSLMGMPVVDVLPGSARGRPLADGDTLVPPTRLDLAALQARALAVRAGIDSLRVVAAELQPLLQRRGAAFTRLEQHLSIVQQEFGLLTRTFEGSPALALLGGDELSGATAQLSLVLEEIGRALARQQEAMQAAGGREGLARVQQRVTGLRSALTGLQGEMEYGTLDRMRRDSALAHAVAGARAQLDSLIAEIRSNPLRFAL